MYSFYKVYIIFHLFTMTFLCSQAIPYSFLEHKLLRKNFLVNQNWSDNTIFGLRRYKHDHEISDSLKVKSRFGTYISRGQKMVYAHGHFTYKKNFHGYLFPRIVNNPDNFIGYSGVSRDIVRAGFSSGETDNSGITYENEWMIMQFGRGRQSWGAGDDIQLAISEKSNSYDYGMLDLDFKKLRVRYFHGYLESDSISINRYITGRGIEWNNNKNLLVGISEVIIYSGKNRPIDFSYFNPMSTHLEIELNDRQNKQGIDSGNGVWQFSLDYLPMKKVRLSCNYLYDEFILDKEQKNNGKGTGRAYSSKVSYYPIINNHSYFSIFFSIISVGTNTFKHEEGKNNFVQRNNPLGWQIGSDAREIKLGFDWMHRERFVANLEIGVRNMGEKNIINGLYDPYIDYLDEPFPSGEIENISFIMSKIQWWWKPNVSFFSKFDYNNSNKIGDYFKLNIGIDMFYKIDKYL